MFKFLFVIFFILQICHGFAQHIKFEGVPDGNPLKRNKEYRMYWAGSLSAQIVSLQLRKNDVVVHERPGFLVSGKYQFKLPGDVKLGDYTLVVVDPSTQAVIQTDHVKIKRKIPLVAKIAVLFGLAFLFVVVPA